MQLAGILRVLGLVLAVLLLQPAVALGSSYLWATPDSGLWNDPNRWMPAGVPGTDPGDVVAIDAASAAYTVTLDAGGTSIGGLTLNSADATLSLSGQMSVTNGTFSMLSGTISSAAPILISDGTLNLNAPLAGPAAFTLHGASTFSGAVGLGQTVTAESVPITGGNGRPTMQSLTGIANSGTIRVTSAGGFVPLAQLEIVSGAIVNSSTGRLETLAGEGTEVDLTADIDNGGTVSIGQWTALDKNGAQVSNSGVWTVASGLSLRMTAATQTFTNTGTLTLATRAWFTMDGSHSVFTQNAGSVTVGASGEFMVEGTGNALTKNGGAMTVEAGGTLAIAGSSGTFTQTAGSLNVLGQVSVANGTLNLSGGTISATAPILITDGTLNLNAPLAGPLAFTMCGSVHFNGAVGAGQTVTVQSNPGEEATLLAFNDVTNDGTIRLDSIGASARDTLAYFGTLTNSSTGRLEMLAGSGGQRALNGPISNGGTVSIGQTTVLGGAQLSNCGTWTVANGVTQTMTATATFTNAGTLTIGASSQFLMSGMSTAFTQNSGSLDVGPGASFKMSASGGVFTLNGGTVTVEAGATLATGASGGSFTQTGGSLSAVGQVSLSQGPFSLQGGTISTVAPILITDGTLNLNAPLAGPAAFTMHGISFLSGSVGPGQVVTIEATTSQAAALVSSTALANSGTIRLDAVGSTSPWNKTFAITTGALANGPTGILETVAGSSGVRSISADIDNQGLIRVSAPTVFSKTDAVYANSGTILVNDTATFYGASFTNAPGGRIGGSGTLDLTHVPFTNAGTMAPGSSPGLLMVIGPYAQTSTGILEIEVGGYAVGTQYDRLAVSGAATLSGLVDVILLPGFTPAKGDTFDVFTAGGGITDGGLALAPGDVGAWLLRVDAGSVQVEYMPEPATLFLVAAGGLAAFFRRRRASK
jgi:hypothetical protein